ncbi:chaperone modulator CbpM [Lutimonas halocynthiae]|uniref:chaperone modulator CbpM n=1 Tax=Lutimonas halocynthiae TaxID=1446477 RepID=UPI0025B3085D|nr:chaperone modulator CbpM [Lutimonas halocynthiae]MDN3643342.1 chaperone modulator CbpM [Lutimonas halocynthiae]
MDTEKYIPVLHLCDLYQIEISFFKELNEEGLIELVSRQNSMYVLEEKLYKVERIIRIHRELNVNIEGIDVVLNLLEKVDTLQNEVYSMQSRLRLYEDDQ